jgi:hypothetical protein
MLLSHAWGAGSKAGRHVDLALFLQGKSVSEKVG